jgi:cyclophilin family peptidyl-prolyl cis-trans isomerase
VIAVTAPLAAAAEEPVPLAAERLYNGIDRPIPIHIEAIDAPAASVSDTAPDETDLRAAAELRIALIRPDGQVVAEAAAEPGDADLAQLCPALWSRPAGEADLLYAQLVAGDERRGPALVLQPMLTPTYPAGATTGGDGRIRARASIDRTGRPSFLQPEEGQVVYSGLRIWSDCQVVLDTSAGRIELIMRPDEAPNTVWHFLSLVEGGLYTDVPFHRIVPDSAGHPFVIQTGDPSGTGAGGAGFYVDLEPSGLEHGYGVVSMARAADPNSNGSQFFISLSREATRHLDGAYTSFAQVVSGGDAIARIAAAPIDEAGRPIGEAPRVLSAWTEAAPPRGAGPEPLERPDSEPLER